MSSIDRIKEIVVDAGLSLAGEIAANPTAERTFFIPVMMKDTVKGHRNPSGKLLADVRKTLLEEGFIAEFLLKSDAYRNAEESLRHSLISSYPNLIRNSFLSGMDGLTQVWLETKKTLNQPNVERIEIHVQEFARRSSIKKIKVNLLNEIQTPTKIELLSAVRQIAPASLVDLRQDLVDRKLEVPSTDWLTRKLNSLKKDGLVVLTSAGDYVLTLDALRRLGTSKGRKSRDVVRILALGRRGG